MAGIEEEDRVGKFAEQGRVKNVQQQFVIYEDEAMAHNMQMEEFELKYGLNRFNRRTVRDDIPVAKVVQSEEEERKQREEMARLERQKMLADEDERIAKDIQARLMLQEENDRLQHQLVDEERTRRLLEAEQDTLMQDEEFARQLQEKEEAKFEKKRLERERRKLENQIANERVETERVLAQYQKEAPSGRREYARNVGTESAQRPDASPPDNSQSSSPGSNLFTNIDPTLPIQSHDRGRSHDRPRSPEYSPPGADDHRPVQRTGSSSVDPDALPEDAYAEVGEFAPVPGQKRNTLKKSKDKKPSGGNAKSGSCKQQ